MAFLREELPHLFDDRGIDASKYDERVQFEDPITKYSSIQGGRLVSLVVQALSFARK